MAKILLGFVVVISIIIFTITLAPLNLFNPLSGQEIKDSNDMYNGVAFKGHYTAMGELKNISKIPPPSYIDKSFRLISEAGLNHIRFLTYWESYEKNPELFIKELEDVADLADKYGLHVIYDNHQWHTSSYLERNGTGFPVGLFSGNSSYIANSGGNTNSETAKLWWTNWWNRKVQDVNGNEGWTLLANHLKKIVSTVDNHSSTLGYEILSEPQVHSNDQWEKVGQFNTFMVNELRNLTSKTLAYSQHVPLSLQNNAINMTSENMAKMAPENKTNIIFKISIYGLPSESDYQQKRLSMVSNASKIAEVPLYFGEWNKVSRAQVGDIRIIDPIASNLTQSDVNEYINMFKGMDAWGSAYWIWNWQKAAVSNFNLIQITGNGTIQTTPYYNMLKTGWSTH